MTYMTGQPSVVLGRDDNVFVAVLLALLLGLIAYAVIRLFRSVYKELTEIEVQRLQREKCTCGPLGALNKTGHYDSCPCTLDNLVEHALSFCKPNGGRSK